MRPFAKLLLTSICLLILTAPTWAQVDEFGQVDTLVVETAKIDDLHWSINISVINDESLIAMSVPLKISSGLNQIVADSCIYTGGRVEHFNIRAFRADTAIQCVTLGMMASLAGGDVSLAPGRGRIATIFVSSLIDEPITDLTVDTTTTQPNNTLEMIADSVQNGQKMELTVETMKKRKIVPVFVARKSQ